MCSLLTCPVRVGGDCTSVTILKTVIVGVVHLDSDEVPVTNVTDLFIPATVHCTNI
jgi:hypothetical protein